jgi:hypothetical protein
MPATATGRVQGPPARCRVLVSAPMAALPVTAANSSTLLLLVLRRQAAVAVTTATRQVRVWRLPASTFQ